MSTDGNRSLFPMTNILEFDSRKIAKDFTEAALEENEETIQQIRQREHESQTIQSIKTTIEEQCRQRTAKISGIYGRH